MHVDTHNDSPVPKCHWPSQRLAGSRRHYIPNQMPLSLIEKGQDEYEGCAIGTEHCNHHNGAADRTTQNARADMAQAEQISPTAKLPIYKMKTDSPRQLKLGKACLHSQGHYLNPTTCMAFACKTYGRKGYSHLQGQGVI